MSGAWAYLRHARRRGVSMKPCGHDQTSSNTVSRTHLRVGHAVPELRRGRARHHAASTLREATDLAVAQAVVDEREEMTGRGDASDVAPRRSPTRRFDGGDRWVTHGA